MEYVLLYFWIPQNPNPQRGAPKTEKRGGITDRDLPTKCRLLWRLARQPAELEHKSRMRIGASKAQSARMGAWKIPESITPPYFGVLKHPSLRIWFWMLQFACDFCVQVRPAGEQAAKTAGTLLGNPSDHNSAARFTF